MDPLHLCIALGPVSVYLLLIGGVNLRRKPFLTSGTRDLMALAIAVSGFVVAGPMELFMPEGAAVYFRAWIWPPLILLYCFCTVLIAMLTRPRLVAYNITADQLRPILENVVSGLDEQRRWSGPSVALPGLGVHLSIESFPAMRNVQLVAVGVRQDLNGWRRLDLALQESLSETEVSANPRGISFVLFGAMIAVAVAFTVASQPRQVAQALEHFLRL